MLSTAGLLKNGESAHQSVQSKTTPLPQELYHFCDVKNDLENIFLTTKVCKLCENEQKLGK